MHGTDYYKQPPDVLRADRERDVELSRLLDEKLERWAALEEKARSGSPPANKDS
jgi:hypothetical protein